MLEQAGIERPPDLVIAVTGDDEDNIVIGQVARERYGVPKVIARVNDPRNQKHFDLLGIAPTVSATVSIMALVEHEVPEHDLVQLLELRNENLEIVEVQIDRNDPCTGKTIGGHPAARGRAPHLRRPRRQGGDRGQRRPSSRRATRCSRFSSRARRTSCARR